MSSQELYYNIPGGYVNGIHYVSGQRIPISSVKNLSRTLIQRIRAGFDKRTKKK